MVFLFLAGWLMLGFAVSRLIFNIEHMAFVKQYGKKFADEIYAETKASRVILGFVLTLFGPFAIASLIVAMIIVALWLWV